MGVIEPANLFHKRVEQFNCLGLYDPQLQPGDNRMRPGCSVSASEVLVVTATSTGPTIHQSCELELVFRISSFYPRSPIRLPQANFTIQQLTGRMDVQGRGAKKKEKKEGNLSVRRGYVEMSTLLGKWWNWTPLRALLQVRYSDPGIQQHEEEKVRGRSPGHRKDQS